MKKKILIGLGVVLVLAQFLPRNKNISTVVGEQDISKVATIPADVEDILKKTCYDCHSNNTVYPWYAVIQPTRIWMDHHVKEGKQHLNFSEFASYTEKKAKHKLDEIIESQEEGWMPLTSYTLIHKNAKLTDKEQSTIIEWAKQVKEAYPSN
ncbi:MAG: heme-binding domain-containing protein [Chitinophagales bacterium]|nr:heme-binding domain-containing protein [Chitinophagales bacterium]